MSTRVLPVVFNSTAALLHVVFSSAAALLQLFNSAATLPREGFQLSRCASSVRVLALQLCFASVCLNYTRNSDRKFVQTSRLSTTNNASIQELTQPCNVQLHWRSVVMKISSIINHKNGTWAAPSARPSKKASRPKWYALTRSNLCTKAEPMYKNGVQLQGLIYVQNHVHFCVQYYVQYNVQKCTHMYKKKRHPYKNMYKFHDYPYVFLWFMYNPMYN